MPISSCQVAEEVAGGGLILCLHVQPLGVLQVGATRTHLVDCPWLDAEAIHPSSSHANIRRAGLMDLPSAPSRYDVIVHNK